MTARRSKRQEGIVLIIVITVLMALIIVAVPFARTMRAARTTATSWVQQEQARIAANGAVSYATGILQASAPMHEPGTPPYDSPLYDTPGELAVRAYTFLANDIGIADGNIDVEDVSGFPEEGFIRIADEWIKYTGTDATVAPNKFERCERGWFYTEAVPHKQYAEVSVAPKGVRWDINVTDEHSRINVNTLTPDGFAQVMRLPLYDFYINTLAKSPTELPQLVAGLDEVELSFAVENVNENEIFTDRYGDTVDGFLSIDNEWIAYRNVSGIGDGDGRVTFLDCSRGVRGTVPATHEAERTVFIEFPLPVARLTADLPPGATTAAIDDVDSLTSGRGSRNPRPYQPSQPAPFPIAFGWLRIGDEWLTYYRVTPNTADDDTSVRGGLRPGVAVEIRRNQVEQRQNLNARHPAQEPVRVPPYPLPTYLVSDAPIPASGGATVKVKDATWFPPQGFINIDGEVMYYSNVSVSLDDGSNTMQSAFTRGRRNYAEFELEIPALGRGLRGTRAAEHLPGAPVYPALYVEEFLMQPFDSVEEMRNPARKAFLDASPGTVVGASTLAIPLQDDARRHYFPLTPQSDWVGVAQLGSELVKYRRTSRTSAALNVTERGAFGTTPAVHSPPGSVRYLYTYNGTDNSLVDQMENIPPAIFDRIRPHLTTAGIAEGPREIPVTTESNVSLTSANIYHDGTVPLRPWQAWLFFPNGETRLITELGLGYVRGGTSVGDTLVSLTDSTRFPARGRALIGGREWVTFTTAGPSLTDCVGLLDHRDGDVVVPDPLYVSWRNAIQWGGDYNVALSEYDSATLRMTNPAKVNINTAPSPVIMAVSAMAEGISNRLSLADAAWIANAIVTKRPVSNSGALLGVPIGVLDDSDLGITYQKKWLFARWFRSAFTLKNKGTFRVEATGTVKGSRRQTAASHSITQIVQVPDIYPGQTPAPTPIDMDTQDYFVDWASAGNVLPDGTSNLAIIGSTDPFGSLHGLDAAGIPTNSILACAQPGPLPQENDPATTFLANYGLSMGIITDSASYDADPVSRGTAAPKSDSGIGSLDPLDKLSPEGIICDTEGIAYSTSYRYTTDGHRNLEAATDSATIAPFAVEMWIKPKTDWAADGDRYLFELGDPEKRSENRVSLLESTNGGDRYFVLQVADALGAAVAETRQEITWADDEWDRWHYVAAVAAGTEPGALSIVQVNRDMSVLQPITGSAYYNPSITTLGYSYRVVDVPLDGYCTDVDADEDEVTFRGYCARTPDWIWDGTKRINVTGISPPVPNGSFGTWTLSLANTPVGPKSLVAVPFAISDPSNFQRPERIPAVGDDIYLMAHDHTSADPANDPNWNWELSSKVSATVHYTRVSGGELWIAAPISSTPPWWDGEPPPSYDPWWEHAPKIARKDRVTGDNPSIPQDDFFIGCDASGANPGEALVDDVKISRLNPPRDPLNGDLTPLSNPTRIISVDSLNDTILVLNADGWPACGWILTGHWEEPRANDAAWYSDVIFYSSRTGNLLQGIQPYLPRSEKGDKVTLLTFIDTGIIQGSPERDEIELNQVEGFPSMGYLELQRPDLSRDPGPRLVGYIHMRSAEKTLRAPVWLRNLRLNPLRPEGSYGTEPVDDPPTGWIATRIPLRYWDRFGGFAPDAPGVYKWVKHISPALVFRARKRLPGAYLESFTWEYHNTDPTPDPYELPRELQGYANVYAELLLDGTRIYHTEAAREQGYYTTPLDFDDEPWQVNRKFDELEVRVYFDYTGPSTSDNAFTSGASNIAPKIDKFILYLRQPVSTAMVIPGEP